MLIEGKPGVFYEVNEKRLFEELEKIEKEEAQRFGLSDTDSLRQPSPLEVVEDSTKGDTDGLGN